MSTRNQVADPDLTDGRGRTMASTKHEPIMWSPELTQGIGGSRPMKQS